MDRREFLAGAAGLGTAPLAAGCLRLTEDGATGGTDAVPLSELRSWAPDPERTSPQRHAPMVATVPPRLSPHEGAFMDRVYRAFEYAVDDAEVLTLPFRRFGGVLEGPHYLAVFGSFDAADAVNTAFSDLEKQGTYQGFDVHGMEGFAVAVDDGRAVVGTRSPATDARTVVEQVVDAGNATGRYVDAHGGAKRVTGSLAEAAYALVVPVEGAPTTSPEHGVFESERGYGVGLAPIDGATERTVVRTFERDPPSAVRSRLPGDPSTDGSTVAGSETKPTPEVTLHDLVTKARGMRAVVDAEFPSVVEHDDGSYDVYGTAFQFSYAPFAQRDLSFPPDATVRLHMSSRDVLHGFELRKLDVERTLVPGEVETIELEFPGQATTHSIRQSRYVGAGTAAMEAEFRVAGAAGDSFGGWFENTSNFTGTVDRRGQAAVEIEVGAEAGGQQFAFVPAAVRVDPGTEITFAWASDTHNVTVESQPDGASWTGHEPIENAGFTFSHTFEVEGVYKYFCQPHRSLGMKGAVVVGER